MALRKTIDTAFGVSVPDAYHRVEAVVLTHKDRMNFHVRGYVNAEVDPFFMETVLMGIGYDLDGPNPIQQAYEYAKTLAEFSGAIDC